MRLDTIKECLSSAFAWIRVRATWRRVALVIVVVPTVVVLAFLVDGIGRARLNPPAARAPSAIYTRPVSWLPIDSARVPVILGSVDGGMQEQREPVELKDVPQHLIDAVIATEDKRFFDHVGLDPIRIGGAFMANVKAGGVAEGGSTITQQLAKNLYLSPSRSPIRKVREAVLATVLEFRYHKVEILAAYLNEIYLGQDGGIAIHGVGAASQFYFGKAVGCLSVAESAVLAAMIRSPNRAAPTRHPEEAAKRRNLVVDLMLEQKRIDSTSAAVAKDMPVSSKSHALESIDARYFRDFIAKSTVGSVPDRGTAIYTTLDAALQQSAERAVAAGLTRLRLKELEAALVAIDPHTGEILAMVGGRDYNESQFNRATDALRQPGSAFKPIVALAALEGGASGSPPYTLASILDDSPLQVRTSGSMWTPTDYDGTYRGPVTLRHALEQSLNIPFARIGLDIGAGRIASTAQRLGVKSKLDPVPSLSLGSSDVTLLEMVRAYGVFASQGKLADTRWILSWRDHTDAIREGPPPNITDVADPAATFLVTSALQGVVRRGTGTALRASRFKGDVAGKTGTSNNWRDAWFIAYSPDIVVGVWVGYDDGRPVRLTGGAAAAPIVAEFFTNAKTFRGTTFSVPDGIERSLVYSTDWWPCGEQEYFLRGTEPPTFELVAQAFAARDSIAAAADSAAATKDSTSISRVVPPAGPCLRDQTAGADTARLVSSVSARRPAEVSSRRVMRWP